MTGADDERLAEKTATNKRVQQRYDELMRIGKHGHYETMFAVVHEEISRLRSPSSADMVERSREIEADVCKPYGWQSPPIHERGAEIIATFASTVAREAREEVVARMHEASAYHLKNSEESVRQRGYEPRALQMKWRTDPPLYGSAEWHDESLHAIIDALCHEGIPAWPGDATSCVQQIIVACIEKERREAREAAIEEAAEIAHRHCWLPAVGVREENDASRIEDAIRALSGTAPQAREMQTGVDSSWMQRRAANTAAPQAGWRHKKRGSIYQYVGEANIRTAAALGDGARVVVYRGEDGSLWVRPYSEFHDGRFERISAGSPPTEDTK